MKNIKTKNGILVLTVVGVLAACGTASRKAPIEDRALRQVQTGTAGTSQARLDDSQSRYVVKKGDTLYRIALEKGQSYNDLVAWNNLTNPRDLKVGQVLQVAPPETTTTGTSVVASPSGVDVRPLGLGMTNSVSNVPSANNKHGPRADKRPYSDAALAELQKNEPTEVATGRIIAAPGEKPAEKAADEIVWAWPVESNVAAHFDDNKSKGVDFSGRPGQNIYAAAAGTVMYAGSGIRGYGNLVIIKHSNNFLSAYAHNQAIWVKEKQVVSKGQKIAEMGNSDSDAVKLHFEIRKQGKPVDPIKFLPAR